MSLFCVFMFITLCYTFNILVWFLICRYLRGYWKLLPAPIMDHRCSKQSIPAPFQSPARLSLAFCSGGQRMGRTTYRWLERPRKKLSLQHLSLWSFPRKKKDLPLNLPITGLMPWELNRHSFRSAIKTTTTWCWFSKFWNLVMNTQYIVLLHNFYFVKYQQKQVVQ